MSGETRASVSSWTVDTLLALMDERDQRYGQRFEAQQEALTAALIAAEKAVSKALEAAEKAVSKAEIATEKRFESMNEFRDQLRDQAATLLSRVEYAAKVDSLDKAISDLTARVDRRDGTGTGRKDMWGWAVGGAGLILTLASIAALIMK